MPHLTTNTECGSQSCPASIEQSVRLKERIDEIDADYAFEQTRLGEILEGAQRRITRAFNGGRQ